MSAICRSTAVILSAVWWTSCAPSLASLPLDRGGVPYANGAEAFMNASHGCAGHLKVTGRVEISGLVDGWRVRGRLRFGVMMGAALRLESIDGFKMPFAVSALGENGTLFLPGQGRILLHEPTSEILETVLGLPFGAATLERLLVCPTAGSGSGGPGERLGDAWLRQWMQGSDGDILAYLRKADPPDDWRVAAVIGQTVKGARWRADYSRERNGSWTVVTVTSVDWTGETGRTYRIKLSLDQLEINPLMDLTTLAVRVPASTQSMTLRDLRGLGFSSVWK